MNTGNTNQNAITDPRTTSNRLAVQSVDCQGRRSAQVRVGAPTVAQALREYLTSNQVAKWLGVSLRTLLNLRRRHVIPYIKIGRLVRFDRLQVEAALGDYTVEAIRNR